MLVIYIKIRVCEMKEKAYEIYILLFYKWRENVYSHYQKKNINRKNAKKEITSYPIREYLNVYDTM